MMDHFLAHYGVKGMKWGVRKEHYRSYSDKASTDTTNMVKRAGSTVQMTRYFATGNKVRNNKIYDEQWYATADTGKQFIEKGDSLNRIVRGVDDRALAGRLYVSKLESDNEMYKAVIPAVQKKFAFGQKNYHSVYQVELQTKKRLAMPSEKERIDTFIEVLQTKGGKQWLRDNGYKDEIDELNAKQVGLDFYKRFNKYAGNQEVKFNDQYFNAIKKKGYDAILDDNDAGIWSKQPTILLSASGTVKVKSVRQLSADEINAAQRSVLKSRQFDKKTRSVRSK